MLTLLLVTSLALAQTEDVDTRLDLLEGEVRALKQSPIPKMGLASLEQTKAGLGPVASKIYFRPDAEYVFGVTAEFFTYNQRRTSTGAPSTVARTSVASLAPAIAVRFTPHLLFNSQLLFENGGSESRDTVTLQKGQSVVKFAYLDWLADESHQLGVRLGHQLVPIGLVNTSDDPTTFFGVLRPELEREIIPASWHENGLAFWIDRPGAELQLGVFTSLESSGFRKDTFLAGGRAQGQNGASDDLMAVLRANAKGEHVFAGLSLAMGNATQGNNGVAQAGFRLFEAHARLLYRRLRLTGQFAQGDLDDAESISIMNSTVIASRARGYSLEAAGDLGGLWVFARTSRYNLHDRVPESFWADPALDKTVNTFGLSYYPVATVVLKADYQVTRGAGGLDLGAGFVF